VEIASTPLPDPGPADSTAPDVSDAAPSALARVGRNSLILLVSQSITWVLSTVLAVVIPRFFGPEPLGWFTISAALWTMAATCIALGTSTLLTLDFARRGTTAADAAGPVVRLRMVTTTVGFAAVLGFTVAADYGSEVVTMVVVMGVATTLASFADVPGSALVGLERMGDLARAEVVSKLCYTLATLALLVLTRNVFFVAAAGIVLSFVRGVMQTRTVQRVAPLHLATTWADVRRAARGSVVYFVAGLALVLYQQVDAIVMSFLVDDRRIGWYGAADGLFTTLLFAPTILTTSLLPALAREHAADAAAARRLLGQSFDALVLFAVPLGLAVLVSARSGVRLLYGSAFDGAGPVLSLHGIVLLFTSFSILLGSYGAATGRQSFWNWLMFGAIGATIPLDLVFVPWTESRFGNGAIGGVLSYVVTESSMVVIGLVVLARHLVDAPRLRRVGACALAGVAQFAAGWPLRDRFVALPAVAGLVAYAAAVLVLRIPTPAERDLVRRLAGRASGKLARLVHR
jgi:O-antigen/teichoic acid export membrane protein